MVQISYIYSNTDHLEVILGPQVEVAYSLTSPLGFCPMHLRSLLAISFTCVGAFNIGGTVPNYRTSLRHSSSKSVLDRRFNKKPAASSLFDHQSKTSSATKTISEVLGDCLIDLPASSLDAEVKDQNIFGVLSDKATNDIFSLLHLNDRSGIKDSSKNLRVLWVRALLNNFGMIDDPIAEMLLPSSTSSFVTSPMSRSVFSPIIKFTEWIQSRTDFIDDSLDKFLKYAEDIAQPCNVVLFGAGYDTRVLRYRNIPNANFYEVDLPDVVEGKSCLYKNFQHDHDPNFDSDVQSSNFLPTNLNNYASTSSSLTSDLVKSCGLDPSLPTLFIWEAVLFYVDPPAIKNIFDDLFSFNKVPGHSTQSALVFTDSLKPFVDVPFTSETDRFFTSIQSDLLEHRSRWGGAVHFANVAPRDASNTMTELGRHLKKGINKPLVKSYTPTQSNNKKVMDEPSIENAWYAVAYPWQIDGYDSAVEAVMKWKEREPKVGSDKPFATRLWNEPLVIYRDEDGEPTCVVDLCPHRSAPLSMGTVEGGQLVCFYHGWKYGKDGDCIDVPTQHSVTTPNEERDAKFRKRVSDCQRRRAVVEHEGLIWVWKGDILSADPSLLPSKRVGDMETQPIDSVLDYNVDYSYIIENNLDSPHLFYLHDGSVPPIESIGMMAKNLPDLRLRAFKDDCGFGHLGRFGDTGRVKKLLRFDPPNIVRHGGVSGFEEEFHIIPIAPYRTRVLLRQHLPKGPILSTITAIPGMLPFLTSLVNNWNYHIALEDGAVMMGQASRIEDLGAARMGIGGLGDDLISRYWDWRRKAYGDTNPWVNTLDEGDRPKVSIPTGTSFGDDVNVAERARSWSRGRGGLVDVKGGIGVGLKQEYVNDLPKAIYAPMNHEGYMRLVVFDDLVKKLFAGLEPSSTMIKTNAERGVREGEDGPDEIGFIGGFIGVGAMGLMVGAVGVAGGELAGAVDIGIDLQGLKSLDLVSLVNILH